MGIKEGNDGNAATPSGRAVEDTRRLKDCMGCKVVRYCGKVSFFFFFGKGESVLRLRPRYLFTILCFQDVMSSLTGSTVVDRS